MSFPGTAIGLFVPPTQSSTTSISDPHFPNVVLLMRMNGTNNSTTFTDVKGNIITRYGNAVISTTQSKFGGASAYFNGNGSYLSVNYSPNFQLTEAFTIESWVYFNAISTTFTILSQWQSGSPNSAYMLYGNPSLLSLYVFNEQYLQASINWQTGRWYHVAATRDKSNNTRLFIDGVNVSATYYGSQTQTGSTSYTMTQGGNSTLNLGIGGSSNGGNLLNGYLDELRVTKGIARYTQNFTPPTTAFADS